MLFIVQAVDAQGLVYDESIFEASYIDSADVEFGGDVAAAEAAAVAEFERLAALDPSVAWEVIRGGAVAA